MKNNEDAKYAFYLSRSYQSAISGHKHGTNHKFKMFLVSIHI